MWAYCSNKIETLGYLPPKISLRLYAFVAQVHDALASVVDDVIFHGIKQPPHRNFTARKARFFVEFGFGKFGNVFFDKGIHGLYFFDKLLFGHLHGQFAAFVGVFYTRTPRNLVERKDHTMPKLLRKSHHRVHSFVGVMFGGHLLADGQRIFF